MTGKGTDPAPGLYENSHWTLIRGARQLLTLSGASGPRRGSAMTDLNMIADGAVLIRDGVIYEQGPTRRVENLTPARHAREIDATGKIVMPAFVDPDATLASAGAGVRDSSAETDIRRMSRTRLESVASKTAADLARYGVITVGAHTLFAPDLPNALKALRVQQAIQMRPLRIRSVCSPPFYDLRESWMSTVIGRKLASLFEVPIAPGRMEAAVRLTMAAASAGFLIRLRVSGNITPEILRLAYSAGAVSLIEPPRDSIEGVCVQTARALADVGCIAISLASAILQGDYFSRRAAIDNGVPIALASGYRPDAASSLNPQYLLFLARRWLGMTTEEAIVATTYNAAYSLRLSHVTGSIDRGKSADICVMDVDDYRELARRAGHHDVSMVLRAGKVIYRRANLAPVNDDGDDGVRG